MNAWNATTEMLASIALAIVGVAIIAVLVSKKSNTAAVIQATGSAFANSLGVAVAPVTGDKIPINTSYPSTGLAMLNMTPLY